MILEALHYIFCEKLRLIKPIAAKDPMDWSLTWGSTTWGRERYCPICKSKVEIEECLARMCNSCGGFSWMEDRTFRKIWDGKKWVVQRKYGNIKDDYTLDKYFPLADYVVIMIVCVILFVLFLI